MRALPSLALLALLVAAACAADSHRLSDLMLGRSQDLGQALICTPGRQCSFSADAKLRTEDTAETRNNRKKDAYKDLEFTVDFHVVASCENDSSDQNHRYFRLHIDEVVGGSAAKASELARKPCFFTQSMETGRIVSVYTSKQDSKAARLIKNGLVANLAKKFSKAAMQRMSEAQADIQAGSFEPIVYDFEGENLNGPFAARHEITPDPEEQGGFILMETLNYKTNNRGRSKDKKAINIKQGSKSKVRVDAKGRVKASAEASSLTVGSDDTPKQPAVQRMPDIGKSAFKMEFDTVRVDKEDSADCKFAKDLSLEAFENSVDSELEGSISRDIDTPYTDEELEYSPYDDVPAQHLIAHAENLMEAGNVDLQDLEGIVNSRTAPAIIKTAWARYQDNELSKRDLKTFLASLGDVRDVPSITALAVLATDRNQEQDLRSQAMLALHPEPESEVVPADVLSHVATCAFDNTDPMSHEALLLLGTLCDNHPEGDEYVTRMRQELEAGADSWQREEALTHAINNAAGGEADASDTEDLETAMDIDEGLDDLDDLEAAEQDGEEYAMQAVDMGWSGSKPFFNKKWRLVGSKNFQLTAAANSGLNWGTKEAKVKAHADMTAKILKYSKALLAADFNAGASGTSIGYKWTFKIVGFTVASGGKSKSNKYVKYGGACPKTLDNGPTVYTKEWSKTFFTFSQRFMLGPVPLKVSVGVKGSVGFKVHLGGWINCASKTTPTGGDMAIMGGAQPWGKVAVSATAAVDAFVARAGVIGSLTILNGALPVYGIGKLKDGCGKIDLKLGSGSGNIKIFAEVGVAQTEADLQLPERDEESPLVNVETKELWLRDKWRRAKSYVRRGYQASKNAIKRGYAAVKRGAKSTYNAVKKGAKYLAKKFHKRWEKVILKWSGGSMTKNFLTRCYPLNLGKFFTWIPHQKKKDDKKKGAATKKPADNKTGGSKSSSSSGSGSSSSSGSNPSAASAATKEGQRTRDAVNGQGKRTRDSARNASAKTRKTGRNQASSTKSQVNKQAAKTRASARHAAHHVRATTRGANRRTAAAGKKDANKNKRAERRSEKREEKKLKTNRKADRRGASRIDRKIHSMKAHEKHLRMRKLMRRQGKREASQEKRVAKEMRRKNTRSRFRRVAADERKDAKQLKNMMRATSKKNKERRNFRRLRNKDRRNFRRLDRKRRNKKFRGFLRRQNDEKKMMKKSMDKVKRKLRREAKAKRERIRLRRLGLRIRKSAKTKKKTRGWLSKIGQKIRRAGRKIKRVAGRAKKRATGWFRRKRSRKFQRRQGRKLRKRVRRSAKRSHHHHHNQRLRKLVRKRFRRGRKRSRKGGRRFKRRARKGWLRGRKRRGWRRVRKTSRRGSRRSRKSKRRSSRRMKRRLRRRARRSAAAKRRRRAAKRLRKLRRAQRRASRRGRKTARRVFRRSRRGKRRWARKSIRVGRRGGKRSRKGTRRVGRRIAREVDQVGDSVADMSQNMNTQNS